MVLMSVDLPKPVWPVEYLRLDACCNGDRRMSERTNADDVELESPLHELLLDLLDVMLSKPT